MKPYYARPGWSQRFPVLLWLQDAAGLLFVIGMGLVILFFGSWTGQ
jgi:hypothetical protein